MTPTPKTDADAPLRFDDEARKKVLHRLRRLEGQVRGLQQMIEDGRSCREVLTLLAGVRSAISATGDVILESYVATCAADLENDPAQVRDLVSVVKLARGSRASRWRAVERASRSRAGSARAARARLSARAAHRSAWVTIRCSTVSG